MKKLIVLLLIVVPVFTYAFSMYEPSGYPSPNAVKIRKDGLGSVANKDGVADAWKKAAHVSSTSTYKGYNISISGAPANLELAITRSVYLKDKGFYVNSFVASFYMNSIEWSYHYDDLQKAFVGYYYIFPAGSPNGWSDPGNSEIRKKLPWTTKKDRPCHSDAYLSYENAREFVLIQTCYASDELSLAEAYAKRIIIYLQGLRKQN